MENIFAVEHHQRKPYPQLAGQKLRKGLASGDSQKDYQYELLWDYQYFFD